MAAPVGIFDSGLGGLTVVKRVIELLPNESIIYVGDTARIPYGPKSPATVKGFSIEIGRYLVKEGAKAIVIACNTASSFGLSSLSATLPVPVLGVIGPGASAAAAATRNGRIGVIGTRGTISSEAYQNAILAIRKDARVFAAPAPLLVPLVEEGHLDDEIARLAIKRYLDPIIEKDIDTLVLGCTHYPLLAPIISRYLGEQITIVDSALAAAHALAEILEPNQPESAAIRYMATDNPEGFKREGERFLGRPLGTVRLLPLEELGEK